MGWWKISGPSGHINWSAGKNNDGAMLFNCIPGRDDPGQMYNGDEPADILDSALRSVEEKLYDNIYLSEAKSSFLRQTVNFEQLDADTDMALKDANEQITSVYQREWRRLPTPAELSAVFEFCTSFVQSDLSSN